MKPEESAECHRPSPREWSLGTRLGGAQLKRGNVVKLRNGITLDFYLGLPQYNYIISYGSVFVGVISHSSVSFGAKLTIYIPDWREKLPICFIIRA